MDPLGRNFTSRLHSDVYAEIDPQQVTLPKPFTLCIIGASRGIGAGIARAFATAGASGIAVCAPTEDELEASQISRDVKRVDESIKVINTLTDVRSVSAVRALVGKVKTEFGRLDLLVYNAGFFGEGNSDPTPTKFNTAFEVNCVGAHICLQEFKPLLLQPHNDDGRVLFFTTCSAAANVVNPAANIAYSISKMAQLRLVETVALEEYGPIAIAVDPGVVKTEMGRSVLPADKWNALPDSPDLCGAFMVWLAKENRSWLSGRYLSAQWDVNELFERRDEIVNGDKLKIRMAF